MKDNERNWLSLKEYELCYPLEYLEFLSVFEENGQKRVLLDDEAIRLIDVLLKKTEELKTEKINNFLKSSVAPKQTQETDPINTGKIFKSTNHFFEKVATGNVANLDIKRYVNLITDNHKLENLKTLEYDISFFIFILNEDLLAEIKDEDWQKKFQYYEQKGEKMPSKTVPNFENIINKKKGLPFEHIPEFTEILDVEAIFYPYELFSIRQLENHIKKLISEKNETSDPKQEGIQKDIQKGLENHIKKLISEKNETSDPKQEGIQKDIQKGLENHIKKLISEKNETSDPKHVNIFCNNGFVLFEHILNNYVKTDRGRKSDISFFYRSMYNNKPQYIHQRPEPFKEWFSENYNSEDLGKIKTLSQVDNPQRNKDYSNALDWFKLQK